jgi:hypothetical protein
MQVQSSKSDVVFVVNLGKYVNFHYESGLETGLQADIPFVNTLAITLTMEAVSTSETLVNTYRIT